VFPVHVLSVQDDPAQLARVREWARDLLQGLPQQQLEDVVLVLDELMSNALQHARGPYRVRLSRTGGGVRLEVDDASWQPARQRPADMTGGRGLRVVAAYAAEWGQRGRPVGKTVWATVTT